MPNTENLVPQDKFSTSLAQVCAATDTIIYLNAQPTAPEGYLTIDEGLPTEEVILYTSKGSNFVTCPSVATGRGVFGSAVGHSLSAVVKMKVVAEYYTALQRGENNIGLHTYTKEGGQNFFAPGSCVWSISSGLIGTMSSGFVYINGKRLVVTAIASKTFVLSNDTYVDFLDNGDGTAIPVYTPQSNNTVSPALASSSARNAIIVTNGTQIVAGNGGINQGSIAATAPTVSSSILTVCDSIGNMIYNITPNPSRIGFRNITTFGTTVSGSPTTITGLSCPVIVPLGRSITARLSVGYVRNSNTGGATELTIGDGTVTSVIGQGVVQAGSGGPANAGGPAVILADSTPTVATKTYIPGIFTGGAGTSVIDNGISFSIQVV